MPRQVLTLPLQTMFRLGRTQWPSALSARCSNFPGLPEQQTIDRELNQQPLLSFSFRDQKSEIKVLAG